MLAGINPFSRYNYHERLYVFNKKKLKYLTVTNLSCNNEIKQVLLSAKREHAISRGNLKKISEIYLEHPCFADELIMKVIKGNLDERDQTTFLKLSKIIKKNDDFFIDIFDESVDPYFYPECFIFLGVAQKKS